MKEKNYSEKDNLTNVSNIKIKKKVYPFKKNEIDDAKESINEKQKGKKRNY